MQSGDTLRERLLGRLDAMSPRLQQAARHLIDHPQDVALLSMRELARHAGVPPATMTRLAQFMGARGFEALRAEQAAAIRGVDGGGGGGLVARVAALGTMPDSDPQGVLAAQQAGLAALAGRLSAPDLVTALAALVDDLAAARRIHVLGSRSCHAVAWQLHYVLSLLGRDVVLLEGAAGTDADALLRAGAGDVVLVISISPYARRSEALARHAAGQGLRVLALTDSAASPLLRHAARAVICPLGPAGLFHSLVPLLAVAETICGLLAARDPEGALAALARTDAQLAALDTYVGPARRRLPPRPG